MDKEIKSEIKIGDIVQLGSASKAIEESMPNMVVYEIIPNKENGFKCKCLWFKRGGKWEFQYSVIEDFALKKDENLDNTLIATPLIKGQLLSLKTVEHELIRDRKGKIEKVTSFCPPAMIFLGMVESKDKSTKAKCLYFNPISNKYSEILLSKEVLIET